MRKGTAKSSLRADEKRLAEYDKANLPSLLGWLHERKYQVIGDINSHGSQKLLYLITVLSDQSFTNTGGAHCSNYQFVKSYGERRYHWRIYDYESHIMIEAHMDKVDPAKNPFGHCMEVIGHRTGLVNESRHNTIYLRK